MVEVLGHALGPNRQNVSSGDMLLSANPDLGARLKLAITERAIRPVFQPIVRMNTKHISSFEVLARWTDPFLGDVSPATFIPLLEQFGLIGPMTDQIIRSACHAAKDWQGEFRLTFNISPRHFQDGEMPSLLEDAVEETGFPIGRTQIEITESALLKNLDAARDTMNTLRSKGVHVLLDDFGTGYSSLARLQALPFDKIKIDASFVGTMESSRESCKIVGAVIGLGQSLGVPVIAEGVETPRQEEMLLQLGCDFAQGWLYSHALPAADVPGVLAAMGHADWNPRPTDLSTNQRLAQLDVIYSLAPVGLCFVDTELRILKANERWFTMLGEEVQESVGRDLTEIAPKIARFARQGLVGARSNRIVAPKKLVMAHGTESELAIVGTRDETDGLIGLALMLSPLWARHNIELPHHGSRTTHGRAGLDAYCRSARSPRTGK